MKRLILLFITGGLFYIFYNLIPYDFYNYSPIIFSLIFSLITVFFLALSILNVSSWSDWKNIKLRLNKIQTIWRLILVFLTLANVGIFSLYFINYSNIAEKEFDKNSEETYAIIIDKWSEKYTRKLQTTTLNYIKVEYTVGGKQIISNHITTDYALKHNPGIGETIKIFYLKLEPEKFETEMEREIRNRINE